ncbi:hypothetical protein L4C37_20210 [Vibrio kagoshimensis]|uniref:hypothetical protein n=1 Tax=Vibrio kagoshimensis TaxID=2910244 RepID=UPI003D1BFB00
MKKILLLSAMSMFVHAEDPFASFNDVPAESCASSIGLTGYAQSSMQYLSRSSEWGSLRQRLWVEPYYRPESQKFAIESAFSIDWDPSVGAREKAKEWDVQMRELYGSIMQQSRTITIGKQMMIWGSGSALSQGNYFNPTDSSDPLASGLAINYLATSAIRWREFSGDDVFDFIVTAEPSIKRLAQQGSMWDSSPPALRKAFENEHLDNPIELGFGYQINRAGFDLFMGGAYVYQDDPAIVENAQGISLQRNRTPSAFFQYNVNYWDGVAQFQARYDHNLQVVNDRKITESGEQWSLLGGWIGYLKEISTEIDFFLTQPTNGKVTAQISQNYHYEWGQGIWAGDVGGVYNFSDDSSLLEIKLSYKPSDTLEYSLGYNGFYGDEQSNYGAFKANTMVSAHLNVYF